MIYKNFFWARHTNHYNLSRILKFFTTIFVCGFILCLILKKQNAETNVDLKQLNLYNNNEADANDISKILYSNVRILCIIFSSKQHIFDRAFHINKTWAKRCNKHLFLTYYEIFKLPYLDFKLPDTREVLWKKVRLSLKWVNDNELNNYDYILRADDDSYFIMENLRFFLLPFNPNNALYFGARFKENNTAYMSGGAGYILSREAVKQISASLDNPNICSQPTKKNFHDDYEIGVCVKNLNITSVDTRDNGGRHRMLPWSLTVHFITGLEDRHFKWLYYPYKQSTTFECCAEHMISFHYVYNETLYLLDFLTYHTNLIGSMDKHWQKINKENEKMDLLEKLKLASMQISNNKHS